MSRYYDGTPAPDEEQEQARQEAWLQWMDSYEDRYHRYCVSRELDPEDLDSVLLFEEEHDEEQP